MILSISWKNIWRNKVRSLILIGTITFALTGTIFMIALMEGMIRDHDKKVIETQLSHIQIHNPSFSENMRLADSISNSAEVINKLQKYNFIKAFSTRLETNGMVSSSYASRGALIIGIDPEKEKNVIKVYKYLDSTSKFLDQVKRQNSIVIGKKMAKDLQMVNYQITEKSIEHLKEIGIPDAIIHKLATIKDKKFHTTVKFYNTLEKILSQNEFDTYADLIADNCMKYKIGRKIILRMQDINGNIVEEAFRIVGVFNTNNDLFDGFYVFVKKDYLTQLLGLPQGTINQIVILTDSRKKVETYTAGLKKAFPHLQVESMYDLDPTIKLMSKMIWIYYAIFEAFILFALSFGIVNTMLMAVMERTKELGMLMAVGMNRKRVFAMIMNESVLLTATGGLLGIIFGYLLTMLTSHTGIDFSKFVQQGFEGLGYSALIYPQISPLLLIETALLVVATGILAAIYPAIKAIKLKPAQALRIDV